MIDREGFENEKLHRAAQEGNVEKVKELVAEGYDLNAFDDLAKTPLHYAAEREHRPASIAPMMTTLGASEDGPMWWLVIAIPAAVLGVLGILLWLGARERRETASELAALRAMPDAEAEKMALDLLNRPGLFQTRKATKPFTNPQLPAHVVAVLNRYEQVTCGEFWIGAAALRQPARLPGFLKIGEDSEFTEILVRPGDPRIYISYGEGLQSPTTLETEPTIWHEIIIASGIAPPSRFGS